MKAVVTIEIKDKTREEELRKAGYTSKQMEYLYKTGFAQFVKKTSHPDCEYTIDCVVTDNTKPQEHGEIDFDYEAEV